MKFWLEQMVLWYSFGGSRKIEFQNNKVNVLTGNSLTGKSAVLQIFDYCFFASHSKLPENTINENVSWYGIKFHINDKSFTIARKSLEKGKVAPAYFFSPFGEVPVLPTTTHSEATLKSILELEFGIDESVVVPFGGRAIKMGAKISLRYFLLFTTISEDIITSSSVFFDKQNQPRYAEALPRIFDLAVGIETLDNQLAKDEKNRLNDEIKRLSRQVDRLSKGRGEFHKERLSIIQKARDLGVLGPTVEPDNALDYLLKIISKPESIETVYGDFSRLSEIESEIALQLRIIRNLRLLKSEYSNYQDLLKTVADSLKPISFLRDSMQDVVQTSIFDSLLRAIEIDLTQVKRDIQTRVPIELNINDLSKAHERKVDELRAEAALLSRDVSGFTSDRERFIFLGELKAKLELYGAEESNGEVARFKLEIEELEKRFQDIAVLDLAEERNVFLRLLDELMLDYMKIAGSALGNYENYLPSFDYKTKTVQLRKPRTAFSENFGSSSNHMFMHLFLFLGLHEAIKIKRSGFVPPILFIDQPSRPYWGDGEKKKVKLDSDDEEKIRKAFEVLNHFVERIVVDGQGQCQVIVFEHVPESTWDGLAHVHLVESFTDGNALIRKSDVKTNSR